MRGVVLIAAVLALQASAGVLQGNWFAAGVGWNVPRAEVGLVTASAGMG